MTMTAGLDAGSVSVKLAVLDAAGEVVEQCYRRHQERPLQAAAGLLAELLPRRPSLGLAVTGSAGKLLAQRLAAPHANELLALAAAAARFLPGVEAVVEMGGEDAKLLLLRGGSIRDFAMNSVCAAGTGSFLDQQAERMRLSIEAFSAMAAAFLAREEAAPPRIAGRCSVFAKSDMIHLQQIATPVESIVAGLSMAVARNFRAAIVRNRTLPSRVAFLGGVALNRGMAEALRRALGLDELVVPEPPTNLAAAGAALLAMARGESILLDRDALAALDDLRRAPELDSAALPRLVQAGDRFAARHLQPEDWTPPDLAALHRGTGRPVPAYLGVDIGSISTCLALCDEQGDLLAKRYLRTASRPIEAVLQGLRELADEVGDHVDIGGVGTTGSGRYMIADFLAADTVRNEITAQARGAAHIDPSVDTIFEIGGQDSKYIQLRDGVITDFEMNKACAAGTGSFLEEQAEKLAVAVKDEFAALALGARNPCALGERCTVFMENSLQGALQRGANKADLLAGLAYSIVENYLNRVVAGRPVGQHIFFQGGTAFNKAVVAAFEKHLGRRVTVPEHNDVSGAIGMALIARDHVREHGVAASAFKGLRVAETPYSLRSFECTGCDNRCEINRVRIEGESTPLFYGGRCEKYDIRRTRSQSLPDLFAWRAQRLEQAHLTLREAFVQKGQPARRGRIGLPRAFFLQEYLPYCSTLLWSLGFEVVLSPATDKRVTALGTRLTLAEACFPLKAAFGHVQALLEAGETRLFVPSFVNLAGPESAYAMASACPLTQSFPYQVRAAFPDCEVFAPVFSLRQGPASLARRLLAGLGGLGVGRKELTTAMARATEAQQAFAADLRAKGDEVLAGLRERRDGPALVVIGRAYNAFDKGMNLDIPGKLASLEVQALPMDMLPLPCVRETWPEMYWRSGQRILAAARFVRSAPGLHALYIGNFSCGPDSFILDYFAREMGDKPYLHVEIDEHSADAGVITRCEAFLDSLAMRSAARARAGKTGDTVATTATDTRQRRSTTLSARRRVVYVPRMGDQAFGLKAAFEACGADAVVMPRSSASSLALGRRFCSGKECFPFVLTTGDMLAAAHAPDFDPERSAFFMPAGTGPCRFGQYNLRQKLILERAGFPEVPLLSPVQDAAFYRDAGIIGKDFARVAWKGILAADLLTRCLHETRPYERVRGSTDELYAHVLERVAGLLAGPDAVLVASLHEAGRAFASLANGGERKPRIGIVGEIYVRTNSFANEDLVRRIEALGGEAWLAPVDEWVCYVNWCGEDTALSRRDWMAWLRVRLKGHFQGRIARRMEAPFERLLQTLHDPSTAQLLDKAAPYLDRSFRGEAVLSIGKTLDMLDRGACGVVNAMPFGCMPGTVVGALLRRLSEEHGFPAASIPFDGSESPTMQLQLEAFMEQASRAS